MKKNKYLSIIWFILGFGIFIFTCILHCNLDKKEKWQELGNSGEGEGILTNGLAFYDPTVRMDENDSPFVVYINRDEYVEVSKWVNNDWISIGNEENGIFQDRSSIKPKLFFNQVGDPIAAWSLSYYEVVIFSPPTFDEKIINEKTTVIIPSDSELMRLFFEGVK